jgi:N-acetylglucosamine kinase-like BadF-type ATPase
MAKLIADSGSTKCEWTVLGKGKAKTLFTPGISPYFLKPPQVEELLTGSLLPQLKNFSIDKVFYYGTGCASPANRQSLKRSLKKVFSNAVVEVETDLLGSCRALSGDKKGIVCILGTGSNSCYFNGKRIVKNSPGLGYVLGDEGSGAYLGIKVLQYYLYNTFDDELRFRFDQHFKTTPVEILEKVYMGELPNRYLASFAVFLAENRGHYMIENIIEDGLNDFFFHHICKYGESWKYPIHFTGSIAYGFKDIVQSLCHSYQLEPGIILKNPMEGLIRYHAKD